MLADRVRRHRRQHAQVQASVATVTTSHLVRASAFRQLARVMCSLQDSEGASLGCSLALTARCLVDATTQARDPCQVPALIPTVHRSIRCACLGLVALAEGVLVQTCRLELQTRTTCACRARTTTWTLALDASQHVMVAIHRTAHLARTTRFFKALDVRTKR